MNEVKAAKHLGQHFLRDEAVIARLLAVINAKAGEAILEIGPGLGALTLPLLRQTGAMTAVEYDPRVLAPLAKKAATLGTLHLIHADILTIDFGELLAKQPPPPVGEGRGGGSKHPAARPIPLPRALPALILLILIITLIYYWQPLRLAAQRLQNSWQRDLAAILRELRQHGDSAATWLTLCGLGFLYGILHAVGPGHGKAIIATFTLSQPAARRQTLAIATGGALLQGVSAIIWVALAMGLLQHLIADTVSHTLWLNRANALLIAAIGAYIIYRHRPHRHHAHCACHAHGARPLTPWAAIIAIGIRPCSGAVLSLAVAWSWGIAAAGIAMTLAIACGTALTITAIALLCYHGKQHLARRLLRDETRFARLTQTLALTGGLALVILAALLWQADGSALPPPTNPIGLPR